MFDLTGGSAGSAEVRETLNSTVLDVGGAESKSSKSSRRSSAKREARKEKRAAKAAGREKAKRDRENPQSFKERIAGIGKGRRKEESVNTPNDSFGLISSDDDAFEVSVRNSEPMLVRLDKGKKELFWKKDLQTNLASAAVILAMFSLLLTSADAPNMIPFALPGIVVFLAMGALETLDKERIRLYVAAGLGILLVVSLIVFRKYIGNGWALIMDQLYDQAEQAQAYIYDRFNIGATGENHPNRSMHFALIWGSSLVGLIASLPPAWARRTVAMAAAIFSLLAFAYYGLIPSYICIAVLAVALIFVMSRGSIMSTVTVLVAVMLIFGAVVLLDPGENYGISRADEKFRDRFALRSAFLQSDDPMFDDFETENDSQDEEGAEDNGGGFIEEHRSMVAVIIALLIAAAIAAAAWMLWQRIKKRQAENRKGIDSSDPREAIIAMFPYAVKWLQPAGIDPSGKPFASLVPMIRADISEQYADRFTGMYELWKEAAYSDHDMTAERKTEMNFFLQDTIGMIREKSDLRSRLVNTVKYAL